MRAIAIICKFDRKIFSYGKLVEMLEMTTSKKKCHIKNDGMKKFYNSFR